MGTRRMTGPAYPPPTHPGHRSSDASGGGDQLSLNLNPARPTSQLTSLPGTKWEHIFDMPAPGDDNE